VREVRRAGRRILFSWCHLRYPPTQCVFGAGQIVITPACVFRSSPRSANRCQACQSEHPRVWCTQQRQRGGSPSQSLVGASRIAHCLFPTRASHRPHSTAARKRRTARHTPKVFNTTARRWRRFINEGVSLRKFFHLRRVQRVESHMGKHPDERPRGSVCALVTTPACAVPPEVLEGGCELSEFNTS
jgi:hypothetical protein